MNVNREIGVIITSLYFLQDKNVKHFNQGHFSGKEINIYYKISNSAGFL